MKSALFHEYGGIEKIKYEDAPDPAAGPGEVIVKVKACALNHLDIWVRQGMLGSAIKLPHIVGSEIAGDIYQIGPGVEGLKTGERAVVAPGISCGKCYHCVGGMDNLCEKYMIIGARTKGGYAELVKAPAENILPIPAGLSYEEAAATPLVFMTAWHMLVAKGQIKAGEDVLVLAAGSGVGSAAIQIAKLWGARVIAAAGGDDKLAKAKALGADEVINYNKVDFSVEVKNLTGGKGADIVFENTGAQTWDKSVASLARGGRLITCGATSGGEAKIDLRALFLRQISLIGSSMGTKKELRDLLHLLGGRKLKPVIDRVMPLAQAAEAQRLLDQRKQFGKIILKP